MSSRGIVKWQAIGLLLLTLFVGGLLGAALVGYIVQSRIAAWTEFSTPEGFTNQMLAVIGPITDEQAEVLVPLLNARGNEISERLQRGKRELLGLGEQVYQDLMPHLTPEQRERLTQSREHVRARTTERGLVNFDS
jgi:hypothetical protein